MDSRIKAYTDSDGKTCTLWQMVKTEPEWAMNRIREGEKAIAERDELKADAVRFNIHLEQMDQAIAANAKYCGELKAEFGRATVALVEADAELCILTADLAAASEPAKLPEVCEDLPTWVTDGSGPPREPEQCICGCQCISVREG